jgi:hypothetical protein
MISRLLLAARGHQADAGPRMAGMATATGVGTATLANAHSTLGAQPGDLIVFFSMARASTGRTLSYPGTLISGATNNQSYAAISYVQVVGSADASYSASIDTTYSVVLYAVCLRGFEVGAAGTWALSSSSSSGSLAVSGISNGGPGLAFAFGGAAADGRITSFAADYEKLGGRDGSPTCALGVLEVGENVPGVTVLFSTGTAYRMGVVVSFRSAA